MRKTDTIPAPLLKTLKNIRPSQFREVDQVASDLHQKFFETFDCISCAKCCKSLGPRLTNRDIRVISVSLRMKTSDFFAKYLKTDEDGDYVFQSMPCPFLQKDNLCRIYSVRPQACREYPHTNQVGFLKNLNIHSLNYPLCPAVKFVMSELFKKYET
ncbi:MAG: hypothetical protein CVU05_02055 [Bacteroidetes bacterium HGW-Bacteroidetes-21]|jgi:hypothetical protein|nr:MAG: hypothetical protein CVU05_02055 [Bacteroidetes bacterium HGW-Bacteroidetes-21]